MKKSIIVTCTLFFAFAAFGQTKLKDIKRQVENPEILMNWDINETKEVYKASITRKTGENHADGRTNVMFYPNPVASGYAGEIALFVDRTSEALANTGLFRVYLTDDTDTEIIYDESLAWEQPNFYKWDIWYGYKKINVTEQLGSAFHICVDDQGTGKSYKFYVEQEIKPIKVEPIITKSK